MTQISKNNLKIVEVVVPSKAPDIPLTPWGLLQKDLPERFQAAKLKNSQSICSSLQRGITQL
jgi:hypothetical protein